MLWLKLWNGRQTALVNELCFLHQKGLEPRGVEPLTFCMPCRRAPNCAMAPYWPPIIVKSGQDATTLGRSSKPSIHRWGAACSRKRNGRRAVAGVGSLRNLVPWRLNRKDALWKASTGGQGRGASGGLALAPTFQVPSCGTVLTVRTVGRGHGVPDPRGSAEGAQIAPSARVSAAASDISRKNRGICAP